jgi:hypothetical protein
MTPFFSMLSMIYAAQLSVTRFAMTAVEKRQFPGNHSHFQPVAGKELKETLHSGIRNQHCNP